MTTTTGRLSRPHFELLTDELLEARASEYLKLIKLPSGARPEAIISRVRWDGLHPFFSYLGETRAYVQPRHLNWACFEPARKERTR